VAIADVTLDGAADVIAANQASGTITVYLGEGRGKFRRAADIAAGPQPSDLVVADFNGDGRPDLACPNHETAHVTVLLGDGRGRFAPAQGSPVPVQSRPHPHGLAAGDLDGDGWLDLVTESRDADAIEVLFGKGDGTFSAPGQLQGVARGPYHRLRTADVDRDGHVDVVVPSHASDAITIIAGGRRDARARGWHTLRVKVPDSPFAVAVGDIDGDRQPEILAVHFSGNVSGPSRDGVSILGTIGRNTWRVVGRSLGNEGGRHPVSVAVETSQATAVRKSPW
jgi:hypothetical protein